MKQEDFLNYLAELRSLPPEVPLEPELKPQRLKLDKRIREEQALASGAVLSAILENGEEGGTSPQEGDLVYVHYSIRDTEDDLLYSSRSEEGGSGQAFAFLMEKGARVPRGWELAMRGMVKGQRNLVQVKPEFGFRHPDCLMRPPVSGLPTDQVLRFDITLLHWYPADSVHQYGGDSRPLLKRVLADGTSWETPRPPFEVTVHVTVCCPAYDGSQLTGQRLFTTREARAGSRSGGGGGQPLTLQLGRGLLPRGVEEALSYMSKGERAAYVIPAAAMQPSSSKAGDGGGDGDGGAEDEWEENSGGSSSGEEFDVLSPPSSQRAASGAAAGGSGRAAAGGSSAGGRWERRGGAAGGRGGGSGSACLLPAPPDRCLQCEVELELLSLVQVRDMTGTGEVVKKRLREGSGEFPVDCPLHDTTLRLHYRARPLAAPPQQAATSGGGGAGDSAAGDGGWVYDSRAEHAEPLTVDTGCGELPEGLEMALKLMVPEELAAVAAAPRFAYAGRQDAPPGLLAAAAAAAAGSGGGGGAGGGGLEGLSVEWEVELFDFEREGHWQNLSFEDRYAVAERLKSKGNELYKRGQYKYARARYERLLRLLESTRDFESEEQVSRIEAYKTAAYGNLALACMGLGEHAAAVAACDKGLEYEPANAKLHFRKGRALSLKGDNEEAVLALQLALEHDPSSEKDVAAELAANAERLKAAVRKQKRDMGNFFKKEAPRR